MQALRYLKPCDLEDALWLLERHAGNIKIYAGGTDLMVQLREGVQSLKDVNCILDCTQLPELQSITLENNRIRIGAMTTHRELSENPMVLERATCLAQAASLVGSPQIRNQGTVGGNICNGSLAADTISPLLALNAELTIRSAHGTRTCAMGDFHEKAGCVRLAPDELLVSITIDCQGTNSVFLKLGRRKALAISRMNVAVLLSLSDGVIQEVRIAPGCVFSTPTCALSAENLLIGREPDPALFARAGELVAEEMIKRTGIRWSTAYKKPAIMALTRRALMCAAKQKEA